METKDTHFRLPTKEEFKNLINNFLRWNWKKRGFNVTGVVNDNPNFFYDEYTICIVSNVLFDDSIKFDGEGYYRYNPTIEKFIADKNE